jgi:hypothetical protein
VLDVPALQQENATLRTQLTQSMASVAKLTEMVAKLNERVAGLLAVAQRKQRKPSPLKPPEALSERAETGGLVTDRERTVIERFREYVVVRGRQLEALRRLRSRGRASERLTQLEGQVERDLEDARRLLEELEDRIALAHVAALGPTAGDTVARQHVEALLARADALVHETARDLGTDAPVTAP